MSNANPWKARLTRHAKRWPRPIEHLQAQAYGVLQIAYEGVAVDACVEPPLPKDGFDAHLPLDLLPSVCPLTPEILGKTPYLFPEAEALERWRPRFEDRSVVHIGLHYGAESRHLTGRQRTVPLDTLAPLFSTPQTQFYSL
jgi:hypothetical protein